MSKGAKAAGTRKAPGTKAALREQIEDLERQLSDARSLADFGETSPQQSDPSGWPPDRSASPDPEGRLTAPSAGGGTAKDSPAGDFPDSGKMTVVTAPTAPTRKSKSSMPSSRQAR